MIYRSVNDELGRESMYDHISLYEIPKELIKDGVFFPNNYFTFCIILSVVIFSGFSKGSAEVMSAMHLQMTTVPQ